MRFQNGFEMFNHFKIHHCWLAYLLSFFLHIYKGHLFFQELLGIGCLESLLVLALLKRFPYTYIQFHGKEVYFAIFGSKNF